MDFSPQIRFDPLAHALPSSLRFFAVPTCVVILENNLSGQRWRNAEGLSDRITIIRIEPRHFNATHIAKYAERAKLAVGRPKFVGDQSFLRHGIESRRQLAQELLSSRALDC
ncbi:hypothetical protein X984_3591 [Burkholderia pseudomallei]|nr:hypothetical protein X984_3591 [Burkholderia pseudomallei]